jgi:cysteinyl-tRNA synthetase
VDNIFPHHENEIAQSEAYTGKKFVNYWLHCHHLVVGGKKMAKSKGNFYTLKDILDRNYDPLALRLLLLSTHYRKMLNFTFESLDQSSASLQRIKDFLYELKHHSFEEGENKDISRLIEEQRNNFIRGLSDDLNISIALTAVFEMIRKVNVLISKGKVYSKDVEKLLSSIRSLDGVLAILPSEKEELLAPDIMRKIEEREKARKEKDYQLADQIRNELLQKGIILEDTKDGVRWKKR